MPIEEYFLNCISYDLTFERNKVSLDIYRISKEMVYTLVAISFPSIV
ncbi:hypothetical protein HNP72_000203 [Sphingobacterium soli]|nr:hypothetical protein [Sphingobacterium soli]